MIDSSVHLSHIYLVSCFRSTLSGGVQQSVLFFVFPLPSGELYLFFNNLLRIRAIITMANAAKMPVNHQFPVAPAKRAPIPVLPNATRRIGPAQQSKGTNKGTNNIPKKAQTPQRLPFERFSSIILTTLSKKILFFG
uniref:Uncharacterized protein n=1 Tax=Staphylococcus aureus TaxID=1280 RepID=E4PYJ2_STAAU|nr:hypothetical protein SUM_0019 [Staphylococcus aureus]